MRRGKKRRKPLLLMTIAVMCGMVFGLYYWSVYVPSSKHEEPGFEGNPKPVFYQGTMLNDPAIGSKESLKLPLDIVKEHIDPSLIYEESSESTIITTQDKVVRLRTSELTGMMNEKPFKLRFPLEKKDDKVYLPIDPLKDLYEIELRESEETGAVLMFKAGDTVRWYQAVSYPGKPDRTIPMRRDPSIKAIILADVKQGEKVMVWDEHEQWLRVQLTSGYMGYIRKEQLVADQEETIPQKKPVAEFVPKQPVSGKVNLTWEHVVTKNPDTSNIPPMPGVNVVSPTWFHLEDGEGNLNNLADPAYVKWATRGDTGFGHSSAMGLTRKGRPMPYPLTING